MVISTRDRITRIRSASVYSKICGHESLPEKILRPAIIKRMINQNRQELRSSVRHTSYYEKNVPFYSQVTYFIVDLDHK